MESIKELRTIYQQKEECCGCSVCAAVCPKGAIEMKEDDEGFLYAWIREEKCIHCSLCEKICPMKTRMA